MLKAQRRHPILIIAVVLCLVCGTKRAMSVDKHDELDGTKSKTDVVREMEES